MALEDSDEEETPQYSATDSDYHPDSAFFESNGFDLHKDEIELAQEARDSKFLNKHLTMIEVETYMAIKYGDVMKLKDLGPKESINLNFKIEITKGVFNYPIHLACAQG